MGAITIVCANALDQRGRCCMKASGLAGALGIELPLVVAEWQRNSREIIRVALDSYNGAPTIDLRAWWQDNEGNWRPGRSGLTLSLKHLPALADGLTEALQQARALGLIEPATTKDRTAAERQRRYRQRRNGTETVTEA
jgi:hypothetical protein